MEPPKPSCPAIANLVYLNENEAQQDDLKLNRIKIVEAYKEKNLKIP